MKLTPLDIEQQQFKQVMRGCDPEEVRRFLEQVGDRVEELLRENTALIDQNRRLETQLGEFRAHESQLREALVSAGRMGDEIKTAARKEAELLVAEAEMQAEKIVAGTRDEVVRLSEQARDLRLQKARLLGELRTVVDAHRRLLDTHETLEREDEARRKRELDQVEKARRIRQMERTQEQARSSGAHPVVDAGNGERVVRTSSPPAGRATPPSGRQHQPPRVPSTGGPPPFDGGRDLA